MSCEWLELVSSGGSSDASSTNDVDHKPIDLQRTAQVSLSILSRLGPLRLDCIPFRAQNDNLSNFDDASWNALVRAAKQAVRLVLHWVNKTSRRQRQR